MGVFHEGMFHEGIFHMDVLMFHGEYKQCNIMYSKVLTIEI